MIFISINIKYTWIFQNIFPILLNKIISKIAKELCINHSTILREIDRSANITLVAKYLVHTKIDEIKHLFSYVSK